MYVVPEKKTLQKKFHIMRTYLVLLPPIYRFRLLGKLSPPVISHEDKLFSVTNILLGF